MHFSATKSLGSEMSQSAPLGDHTPGIDKVALKVPASIVHSNTSRFHSSRKLGYSKVMSQETVHLCLMISETTFAFLVLCETSFAAIRRVMDALPMP
jgi:hypothetical protein